MFKIFVGIGILGTPAGFAKAGIFAGSISILFCGCLNMYTMFMQIKCKERIGDHITSYSELGFAVYGKKGKLMVDLFIFISQIGFCIAYLLFIGTQLDQVVCIETSQ